PDENVLVELLVAGQGGSAHRVQRRDHRDAVGGHLLGLLRRRSLPDAERPGRLAGDRSGERIAGTPSGATSWACGAADPCQTPSVRVALPEIAAASGTVQSTSSCPS